MYYISIEGSFHGASCLFHKNPCKAYEDKQYNTRARHLYNIVIFIRDIFFSVCVIREVFLLSTALHAQCLPHNVLNNKRINLGQ